MFANQSNRKLGERRRLKKTLQSSLGLESNLSNDLFDFAQQSSHSSTAIRKKSTLEGTSASLSMPILGIGASQEIQEVPSCSLFSKSKID